MAAANARSKWIARYVAFLSRHDLMTALIALVLFMAAMAIASRLELRSDFTELLPQDDPELAQLRRMSDRIGAPSTLVIAVEGIDPAANERFAEALVSRLQRLVGTDLTAIDYRPHATDSFFERHRPLYADLIDLRRIDDDLEKLIVSRKNPAFIPLADSDLHEEQDDPTRDLRLLRTRLEKGHDEAARQFPHGYYESADRSLLAIVTWTRSSGTGDVSGFRIRDDIQRVVDETAPESFGPIKVSLTGDVPSAIAEHDALKSDIEWVSLICTVLVLLVVALYYRSVIALAHVFFPTLLGVAASFAVTAVTIGYLNTNTAFLGSIILGNGINFGIIFLARYREERTQRPHLSVEVSIGSAIEHTATPTLAAALAAASAYGSLTLTTFRGFRQFGEVGAVGMLLCWIATYSYGPALIHLTERLHPSSWSFRRTASPQRLTRLAAALLRHPRPLLVAVAITTAASLWLLAPLVTNPFEYDFSKLRNQQSRREGAGQVYVKVGRIFPQDLAPVGVAILGRAPDAPAYRDALLSKDCVDALTRSGETLHRDIATVVADCDRKIARGEPTGGLLLAVSTLYDFLPRDQPEKLDVLARLRTRLTDPALASLDPHERREIDALSPSSDLRALTATDLPVEITRRFREVDGTLGRVALVYPVRVWPNWDGHSLIRLSGILKQVRLPSGERVDAAGHPTLFAAMLRSIAHDGPIATGAAFVGVALIVIAVFRRARPVMLVLASLCLGVVWMAGAGAVLGLKLNFLNFVVLPVTFGIGVDYAVNILARLEREPRSSHARALSETGSAVALCSSTTIIGYSSLLIASNGALRSFGTLAALGELACLLAGLVVVPVIARSLRRADVAIT